MCHSSSKTRHLSLRCRFLSAPSLPHFTSEMQLSSSALALRRASGAAASAARASSSAPQQQQLQQRRATMPWRAPSVAAAVSTRSSPSTLRGKHFPSRILVASATEGDSTEDAEGRERERERERETSVAKRAERKRRQERTPSAIGQRVERKKEGGNSTSFLLAPRPSPSASEGAAATRKLVSSLARIHSTLFETETPKQQQD
jgi:hypothetical protein